MGLVFFGTTQLGEACCRALIDSGVDVCGIVTSPSAFQISYAKTPVKNVLHADFEALGKAHGIPTLTVESGSGPAIADFVASCGGSIGLAVGWYYMLGKTVRDAFKMGVLGIHGSLLPKYRGGAPFVWAKINQEPKTGVTLFQLEDGVDTGDIYDQEVIPITRSDTIADILTSAETASRRIVTRAIPRILSGDLSGVPQDHTHATLVPQRSPADGRIDWTRPSLEVEAFIRAQTRPYPGAFTVIGENAHRIWQAEAIDEDAAPTYSPGSIIVQESGEIRVATGDGLVQILDAESGFEKDARAIRHMQLPS